MSGYTDRWFKYKPGDKWPNGREVVQVEDVKVRCLCLSESLEREQHSEYTRLRQDRATFSFVENPSDAGDYLDYQRVTGKPGQFTVGKWYDLIYRKIETRVPEHTDSSQRFMRAEMVFGGGA